MTVVFHPNVYIVLVALILFVPYQWLSAWLFAVAFHEIGHWLAVRLLGGHITKLTIGVLGANMQASPLVDWKRIISIMAGPILGLTPIIFRRWFPRTAICSWLLSLYNLLPLLPLDGGRILQILIGEDRIFRTIETILLSLMLLCALYASFALELGILPVAIVCIHLCRLRKSPCKRVICKVK